MSERPDFTAPWEARVFAIADRLRQTGNLDWAAFQQRVAAELSPDETPTYGDWLAALEALLGPADGPGEGRALR